MPSGLFNLYTGSETGILKGINLQSKAFQNINKLSGLDRTKEIVSMCWQNDKQTEAILGLKNGTVQQFNSLTGDMTDLFSLEGGGKLIGTAIYDQSVISCTEAGDITIWKDKANIETFNVGKNVYRLRQNPDEKHLIATGGKENELKIWDLTNKEQAVFTAKNVKNDYLDLRVPVWVYNMQFLPSSSKIITSTGYHEVRLYDPSTSQRRPVMEMEFDEYPIIALSITRNENQVLVGNSRGKMALLDLRKKLLVHCYRGVAGSIREIQCHPTLPLVASCGLDRFVRIHGLDDHKLLYKIYLKSRLSCLLLSSDWSNVPELNRDSQSKLTEETRAGAEEDEEMWDSMVPVKTTSKRSKDVLVNPFATEDSKRTKKR